MFLTKTSLHFIIPFSLSLSFLSFVFSWSEGGSEGQKSKMVACELLNAFKFAFVLGHYTRYFIFDMP
jgi:hypothetical protein